MNPFRRPNFYVWLFFIFIVSIIILFYLNLVYYGLKMNIYFYISLSISFSSFLLLILYSLIKINSISTYMKILKKFDLSDTERFNLDIRFPENDEFGNLGKYLNNFVKTLSEFDNLKREKITLLDKGNDLLIDLINIPTIVINEKLEIVKVNNSFYKELKISPDLELEKTKINILLQGEEPSKYFTDMLSGAIEENKKYDISCNVGNSNYSLTISYNKVTSYNFVLSQYYIFINKKHKTIFNK